MEFLLQSGAHPKIRTALGGTARELAFAHLLMAHSKGTPRRRDPVTLEPSDLRDWGGEGAGGGGRALPSIHRHRGEGGT